MRAPGVRTPADLRAALAAGRFLDGETPLGERPPTFPAAAWRRMSRLSRLVAAVAVEALEGAAIDRAELATIWGTAFGELETTTGLLARRAREGPDRVSPSAFQTSLFGTPLAHLSIALGLTGPSETVCAGGCTSAMAVMRGIDAIRAGAPAALVLAGDERTDAIGQAWALSGASPRVGEAVAALLLAPGERGPSIRVVPGEVASGWRIEDVLGACPSGGLALVAAACSGSGAVCEREGASGWTILVEPG